MKKSKKCMRSAVCFAFAPFFVAAYLIVLMLLRLPAGTNASSSTSVLVIAAVIFTGLAAGVVSLIVLHSFKVSVRILIGLLYIPAVIFSLLLTGF